MAAFFMPGLCFQNERVCMRQPNQAGARHDTVENLAMPDTGATMPPGE